MFGLFLYSGCSVERKNIFSQTYHNITAHYNAYFIAREHMKEVEKAINENEERNFNKVLRVYPQVDSAIINSKSENLEECYKKASIAIQRHKNSKWVDDSYILVGKSWYYQAEFQNAVDVFKIVNKDSEHDDTRHEALIDLMRTYIDNNEHNNAVAVSDYLKKEKLNKQNTKELALNRAYLYQIRENYDEMVKHLVIAAPLLTNQEGKAKINFIIGQIYQMLGFDAEAYNYYAKSLKSNPDYELSFYTKLNMAQVTELSDGSDVKKVRKYFRGLLRDSKNKEFKDKIYYEMGEFELKQENVPEAINYYKNSIASSVSNPRQKGYSYLRLGELYYDHFKEYETAKAYYDSVVSVLPQDDEQYISIKERQEILADFVEQITTIRVQDSLLHLASLDTTSLLAYLDKYIEDKEKEKEKAEKERERVASRGNTNRQNNQFGDQGIFNDDQEAQGSQWYFYNSSAISIGQSEFMRKWGNRKLEDNWRRSRKSSGGGNFDSDPVSQSENVPGDGENLADAEDNSLNREALLATIPFTPEEQQEALVKIEHAYYNLGNIYNFELNEKANAGLTFEELLSRFPASEYKPEVLYLLYLIHKGGDQEKYNLYKNQLVNNFPNTIYAKLILNPNYREESNLVSEKLQQIYQKAYKLFEKDSLSQAMKLVKSGIEQYPDNAFTDNLKLLEILITGKVDGVYNYQFSLNNFIESNPNSDVNEYAQVLLQAIETHKVNMQKREGIKFSLNFDQNHYFTLVYNPKDNISERLINSVNETIKSYEQEDLKTANLILNDNYSMIMINEFSSKDSALEFYNYFNNEEVSPLADLSNFKIYNFVITKNNFQTLYSTKGLDQYVTFFNKHY